MGKVLAMNIMRRLMGLGLAAAVAACSSTPNVETPFDILAGTVGGVVNPPETVDARDVLTPELIASSPTSALLAVSQQLDVGYTLIPQAINGNTVQWIDPSGGGLIRRDGLLVGTRGLGFDLFTADLADLSRALRAGGARDARRVERILEGDNQIRAFTYYCDVVPMGPQLLNIYGRQDTTMLFEERCAGDEAAFTNRYWLRQDGLIVRSVERVSAEYGALELTLIAQ
ncbi:MAG: YjbF family lipoprotein [Pseudomonadota bacterium]